MNLNIKYRPKEFDDVIGQENIIKSLQNDITSNNISPAYLFVGNSGIGKTTMAKIFAKKINGETIEIDAASNNSVESIRSLIKLTETKPICKNYYVIILDECHSLSSSAWQPLLSVLENPGYRKFIFCTTEVQKVPKTIYNRCIVHNFINVSESLIVVRLKDICDKENIKHSNMSSLILIAQLAQGSVRQAITFLETVKDDMYIDNVKKMLCVGTYDNYFNILFSIIDKNYKGLVKNVDKIENINSFVAGFFTFILDVNIYEKTKDIDLLHIPMVYKEELDSLSSIDFAITKTVLDKLYDLQFLGKQSPILKQLFLGMCYIICEK